MKSLHAALLLSACWAPTARGTDGTAAPKPPSQVAAIAPPQAATTATTVPPPPLSVGPSSGDNAAATGKSSGTLLLGDSMMRVGVAPILRHAITDTYGGPITLQAKSATGLARPDAYDWPETLKQVLAGKHYARAIVYLGSNDCQDLSDTDGERITYGTPQWSEEYRARVHGVLSQLCEAAQLVLWLELPPMRNPKFNGRIKALNTLLAAETAKAKCARFVSIATQLADKNGRYAEFRLVKKQKISLREDDGVHLTRNGGKLVTEAVMSALKP